MYSSGGESCLSRTIPFPFPLLAFTLLNLDPIDPAACLPLPQLNPIDFSGKGVGDGDCKVDGSIWAHGGGVRGDAARAGGVRGGTAWRVGEESTTAWRVAELDAAVQCGAATSTACKQLQQRGAWQSWTRRCSGEQRQRPHASNGSNAAHAVTASTTHQLKLVLTSRRQAGSKANTSAWARDSFLSSPWKLEEAVSTSTCSASLSLPNSSLPPPPRPAARFLRPSLALSPHLNYDPARPWPRTVSAAMEQASGSGPPPPPSPPPAAERDMGFAERAVSAAGAAVVSAILVNPLDVAKVRAVVTPLCFFLPYDDTIFESCV
ncbi:hypothetical protein HU200_014849 [Digitaria exilis]|uniref:Uncharacterized protein n=1 Tax=Digitaria exilis TaxID=1010633 RepID=A0A835KJV5_9POAL|nr:hypothetical protein HU200_014849 [Digitaria exilis]